MFAANTFITKYAHHDRILNKSELSIPLDVHTGRIARDLGLLSRNQNDSKSVQEIDLRLREMDPVDPVKYDFALFGLGVYEKF